MTQIRTVVAAALIDGDGRLLAARRSGPPELAGRWELPGGKVEMGETDEQALVRECREELGVGVEVGPQVGGDWPVSEEWIMRVRRVRVCEGRPQAGSSHTELRWLVPGRWSDVDWLAADLDPIVALSGCENPAW